jgi:hypothetical protein
VESSYEHDNEPSGSIKLWEVPEELQSWWLLKKSSFVKLVRTTRRKGRSVKQKRDNVFSYFHFSPSREFSFPEVKQLSY